MFCWSCGHENADAQRFCGDCGKSLLKPEPVVRDIASAKSYSQRKEIPEPAGNAPSQTLPLAKQETVMAQRPAEQAPPSNPLVEEPRVVHEKPVAPSPVMAAPVMPPFTQVSPVAPLTIRDRM